MSLPPALNSSGPAAQRDPSPFRPGLAVYYGRGELERLMQYRQVAVQPDHYRPEEVRRLQDAGVQVYAYLSVGEDAGTIAASTGETARGAGKTGRAGRPAPWAAEFNPLWPSRYADPRHPAWRRRVLGRARAAREHGFSGLLLDTLEVCDVYPAWRAATLSLLRGLRRSFPDARIIANRGFCLYPELASLAHATLLEGLSTTWEDGGRRLNTGELKFMDERVRLARRSGLDIYGLDYATTPALRRFAEQRAASIRVPTFVSRRDLDLLP